jgi:hypothetical protein
MSKNAIYACTPRKLMYLQVWPFFKAPYLWKLEWCHSAPCPHLKSRSSRRWALSVPRWTVHSSLTCMVYGVPHLEAGISPRKFEVYLNTRSSNLNSNIIQMSKKQYMHAHQENWCNLRYGHSSRSRTFWKIGVVPFCTLPLNL